MRNLKLVLEYDGAAFYGFQRQPRHITIQETLENSLSKILNRRTKIQAASGRTDTGVHAAHQVINFMTANPIPPGQLLKGLNALLPNQIAVKKVLEVGKEFHARYSARSKTYEYRIWNSAVRSPFMGSRSAHVPVKLNLPAMKRAVSKLRGKHDFQAFCAAHGSAKSTVRTIKSFRVSKKGPLITVRVEADGFLYHMVRNLVGTLLEVGKGRMSPENVGRILRSKDRRKAGPTAPSGGLTLADVKY